MFERLKGMIERNRQLREIEGMVARDLGDMGVERDELSALIQTPAEVLARQSEMARKFDLEDSDFGPHRHDHALVVERCACCGAAAECRRFLADPASTAEAAVFCPNAGLYSDLASDKTR